MMVFRHVVVAIILAGVAFVFLFGAELLLIDQVLAAGQNDALAKIQKESEVSGDAGRNTGGGEQTLEILKNILDIVKHPLMLFVSDNTYKELDDKGKYAEALQYAMDVLVERRRVLGDESHDTLATMGNIAVIMVDIGRYADAEQMDRQLLEIQRRVLRANHPDTILTISNLAVAVEKQGRYAEAEILGRIVLEKRRRVLGVEHHDTLISMDNLATNINDQGRHAEAEILYRQALKLFQKNLGNEHPATLTCMNNLAVAVNDQGRHAEAEKIYRQVLEVRQRVLGKDHPDTLLSMHNVASVMIDQGRYAESERLDRINLDVSQKILGNENPYTLSAMNNLAVDVEKQGRYAEAERLYSNVLEVRRRILGSGHHDTLWSVNNLADTLESHESFVSALSIWEEGFSGLPEYFAKGTGSSFKEAHWLLPLSIVKYLEAATKAARKAALSTNEAAARSFSAQGWMSFGALDVALADLGARQAAGNDAEGGALRDMQQAREDLQDARQAYLKSFDQNQTLGDAQRSALSSRVAETEARFASTSDYLSKTFPKLADQLLPRALTADEAQSLLRPGEGLIAYAATEKVLYAWLVTRDRIEWRQISLSRADLRDKVALLRRSLDLSLVARTSSVAPECALGSSVAGMENRVFDLCLAKNLHDQLLSVFNLTGLDELIVVPDGPLAQLPFSLLVTSINKGDTPHWLIEDHAISVLPGTSSLRALRQAKLPRRNEAERLPFLGVAPVSFDGVDGGLNLRSVAPALPNTKDEVTFISALLSGGPDSVVLGAKATEAFLHKAKLNRYGVISLATHAILSKEAKTFTGGAIAEPALLFRAGGGEDGFLTATEVASLRLDADWVLLSACNTGAGGTYDAEGLSGLARAFFFAGARSLLVSNWSVDDAAAKELMIQTMQNSASNRMSRAQALRQAMLNVMHSPDRDFRHPFFWAPFSLVGESAPFAADLVAQPSPNGNAAKADSGTLLTIPAPIPLAPPKLENANADPGKSNLPVPLPPSPPQSVVADIDSAHGKLNSSDRQATPTTNSPAAKTDCLCDEKPERTSAEAAVRPNKADASDPSTENLTTAILYVEPVSGKPGTKEVGKAFWKKNLAAGELMAFSVKMPDERLAVAISVMKNNDPSLPASAIVDIKFLDAGINGPLRAVPGISAKKSEKSQILPLIGVPAKLSENEYWFVLSGIALDGEKNKMLLGGAKSLELPITFTSGRRGRLDIEMHHDAYLGTKF